MASLLGGSLLPSTLHNLSIGASTNLLCINTNDRKTFKLIEAAAKEALGEKTWGNPHCKLKGSSMRRLLDIEAGECNFDDR
jgi:hypothetical protein